MYDRCENLLEGHVRCRKKAVRRIWRLRFMGHKVGPNGDIPMVAACQIGVCSDCADTISFRNDQLHTQYGVKPPPDTQ